MFNILSSKMRLKRKETEIKNLCANDEKFLPKLLVDTSTALLQVGLDFTAKPTLTIACPLMLQDHPGINSKNRRNPLYSLMDECSQFGLSICIFVGDDPTKYARIWHQNLIEWGYDFQEIKTGELAHTDISILISHASICIKLPDFEIRGGKLITPSEAEIIRDADIENELIKKQKEDERTGLKLVQSDKFNSALKRLVIDGNMNLGQSIVLEDLTIEINYKRKYVKVPFDPNGFHGSDVIDWEDLHDLGNVKPKGNLTYTRNRFSELLDGEDEFEKNDLTIFREYTLRIGKSKLEVRSSQSCDFKINDNQKGISPIKDTFGKQGVDIDFRNPNIFLSEEVKKSVQKFIEIYTDPSVSTSEQIILG
jgi:hypothetical protein